MCTPRRLNCYRGHSLVSPHESSGKEMVDEKHMHFLATYGFASRSLASQEFLTPKRLESLATAFGIHWNIFKPFYGLQWALRPLRAKLKGRRTPRSSISSQ